MNSKHTLLFFILISFIKINTFYGQEELSSSKLSKKEIKAEKKKKERAYLKGHRFEMSASYIYANLESSISFEGPNGVLGAKLSFEDFLGFNRQSVIPKFDFQYSMNLHSGIYAEYYDIRRNVRHNIDEDFEWGDIEIPEDAGELYLFLNTKIWSVGYIYSFVKKPNLEVSFFANLFILGISTGVDLDYSNIHEKHEFTAPLPSLGYRFNYEILPKVRFGVTHSFFFLEMGDYGGAINSFKTNIDYRTLDWLSIGVSYSVFSLDVSSEAKTFKGIVEYSYDGPGLYLNFLF